MRTSTPVPFGARRGGVHAEPVAADRRRRRGHRDPRAGVEVADRQALDDAAGAARATVRPFTSVPAGCRELDQRCPDEARCVEPSIVTGSGIAGSGEAGSDRHQPMPIENAIVSAPAAGVRRRDRRPQRAGAGVGGGRHRKRRGIGRLRQRQRQQLPSAAPRARQKSIGSHLALRTSLKKTLLGSERLTAPLGRGAG